jgi:hypothetical protein
VIAAQADEVFAMLPTLPLDVVYSRWFWVIPPIRRVIYTDGTWSSVGQKRTMVLAGGSAVAEVVEVDRPRVFVYRLTGMTGLLAPLIRRVDGRVDFKPINGGTELTWRWTIHPRTALAAVPVQAFGALWPTWAGKALDYMADELATRRSL